MKNQENHEQHLTQKIIAIIQKIKEWKKKNTRLLRYILSTIEADIIKLKSQNEIPKATLYNITQDLVSAAKYLMNIYIKMSIKKIKT